MVPHYSVCANSKSADFAISSDSPLEGSQAATKPAWSPCIQPLQLSTTQSRLLPARTVYARPRRPYRFITRLTAFRCPYRHTRSLLSALRSPLERSTRTTTFSRRCSLTTGYAVSVCRNAGRADRRSFLPAKQQEAYSRAPDLLCEQISVKFKGAPSSTAKTVHLAGYPARDRGATQPSRHDQELPFQQFFRASAIFQQCYKCKQPPQPDGCLVAVRDHQAVICQLTQVL